MATILLADDSDDLRTLYGACLRGQGHNVVEAADGLAAVEQVRKHRPDLLLLDVWMPELNGYEVLDALRAEPAALRLKVIMLSVLDDGEAQLQAFGGGAVDYLVKGAPLTALTARIDAVLASTAELAALAEPI